jgi:NitT/TauT family transport system substrate-binding protein
MKKIILIIAFVAILAIGGFVYYQQFVTKSLGTVVCGLNVWPGNLPNLVAYDMGFFKRNGLDVKMAEINDYSKLTADFNSGKVDFSGFALNDVIAQAGQGNDLKVVLAQDFSNGADGIVAKKDLKNILDLKGKKIAVAKNTLSEYLLIDALKKNNLSLADIQEVDLSAPEAAQAFIKGEVDAAVTWEPDYSEAVKKGDGWKIYTSANSPGLIVDALVFKGSFIKNNHDKVAAVVKSYFEGMDYISTNPETAFEIGAKYSQISVPDFKRQYSGLEQVALAKNLRVMSFSNSSDSLHKLTKDISEYLLEKKLIKNSIDSTSIIDPQFIRGLIK